ncbi:vascular endothelial growth factor D-like [Actinia tenebrosa]|uniref:Vascular endothelial growth factor D-like n=1 Tax=Actinia tenebrosa TaxID=6105 RepID=A0A6P8HPG0_ACTTE|nr:vascular endothelial growth factor D-like [Actinia tenebrosa]XP_031558274.1 vascular endothelial growth factor D-like [Actinia tenebrosa]
MEKTVSVRVLLGVLLIVAVCLESTNGNRYHAHCDSRPTVVRVDEPQYRYYPFFVTLNRCDGSCSTHPGNQACKPIEEEEVKIELFHTSRNEAAQVVMTNHTRCKCKCVASFDSCHLELESWDPDNCRCICRYPHGPPQDLACKPGFRWVRDICRCRCNKAPEVCPPNKVWSEESCGCVCTKRITKRCERKGKVLDPEKCECVDIQALLRRDTTEDKSKSRLFITLLVGQGFLLVVIICVLIHYIRKSKRKTPPPDHEEENTPNPTQSPADSGNISINSSQDTCEHGLTSNENFNSSNGSVNLWNGILLSKETVID